MQNRASLSVSLSLESRNLCIYLCIIIYVYIYVPRMGFNHTQSLFTYEYDTNIGVWVWHEWYVWLELCYVHLSLYRTIMVSSTIAKLYNTIIEQKVNAWVESKNKSALGQTGFRPKYSTIDHLVNYGRKLSTRKDTLLLMCWF